MAIQIQPLDLASVYGNVAAIQGAQQQNRLLGLQTQQAEQAIANQGGVNRLLGGIDYAAGASPQNLATVGQLYAYDPTMANGLRETLSGITEAERAQVAQRTDDIARAMFGVNDEASYNAAVQKFGLSDAPAWNGGGDQYRLQSLYRAADVETLLGQMGGSAPTSLMKEVEASTGFRIGTPEFQQALSSAMADRNASSGVNVEITNDLAPNDETGVTTGTTTSLESRIIQTGDAVSRLQGIKQSFSPEFLGLENRLGFAFNEGLDKFGLLSEGQQSELRDYSVFRRRAFDNLSRTLNELSGAAVSPEEAKRIQASLPNPGNGLFDGDSPTVFDAKLNDSLYQLQLANARLLYLRSRGIPVGEDFGGVQLGSMESIIQDSWDATFAALKSDPAFAGADDAALTAEADARTKQAFGLF